MAILERFPEVKNYAVSTVGFSILSVVGYIYAEVASQKLGVLEKF